MNTEQNYFKTALHESAFKSTEVFGGIFTLLLIAMIVYTSQENPQTNLVRMSIIGVVLGLVITFLGVNIFMVRDEKREIIRWYNQIDDDTSFEGFGVSKTAQTILEKNFHFLSPTHCDLFGKTRCLFPFFKPK